MVDFRSGWETRQAADHPDLYSRTHWVLPLSSCPGVMYNKMLGISQISPPCSGLLWVMEFITAAAKQTGALTQRDKQGSVLKPGLDFGCTISQMTPFPVLNVSPHFTKGTTDKLQHQEVTPEAKSMGWKLPNTNQTLPFPFLWLAALNIAPINIR